MAKRPAEDAGAQASTALAAAHAPRAATPQRHRGSLRARSGQAAATPAAGEGVPGV